MKVFISHSHAQADDADALALALRGAGHEARLDRDLMKGGDEYNAALRDAIQSSDLFVFLITPQSVKAGSFARSEVEFARQRWSNPIGRVLPVMWVTTSLNEIPKYLQTPTILYPSGNAVAETVARVTDMASEPRRIRRTMAAVGGITILVLLIAVIWKQEKNNAHSCLLRIEVDTRTARATTVEAGLPGAPRSFIVGGDGAAQVEIVGLTGSDDPWILEITGADGKSLGRFSLRGCPGSKVDLDDGQDTRIKMEPRN